MADRPMTEEERAVAQLYDRLYHRTDIVPHYVGRTVALGLAAVWCLFGLWNFLVLARDIPIGRERALLALGFGPLYQLIDPPGLRGALPIAGRQLPVRIALVLVAGPALAVCVGLSRAGSTERLQRYAQRRRAQRYARAQGRPLPDVAARQLGLGDRPGVPLGQVQRAVIGLPYGADKGHIAVIAPTRSGKGLHLTDTLLRWPGAAVVVDPKREQWTRTAGYRLQYGPVYEVPVVGVDLLRAFDPRDPLDVQELHSHLLRPWQDRERIFAEKSLALFQAAMIAGRATGAHPLRLLATWAELAAPEALRQARVHAAAKVDQFLDGDPLDGGLNRFTQSAWGTFTTRFGPLVPHIATVSSDDVPADWLARGATIYLTYPLDQLQTAGALVAAVIAGLIKGQMRHPTKEATLFAIDEMPTAALYNLDTYLATIGGYGATALIYMQSLAQLEEVYGPARARSILANCHHQLFYPPRDVPTAKYVSEMFGTELIFPQSVSTSSSLGYGKGTGARTRSSTTSERVAAALEVPQVLALPEGAVVLFTTLAGQQDRLLAGRMNPIPVLGTLPPPPRSWTMSGGRDGGQQAAALDRPRCDAVAEPEMAADPASPPGATGLLLPNAPPAARLEVGRSVGVDQDEEFF